MRSSRSRPLTLRAAIVLSIVMHALVLVLTPLPFGTAGNTEIIDPTVAFIAVTHEARPLPQPASTAASTRRPPVRHAPRVVRAQPHVRPVAVASARRPPAALQLAAQPRSPRTRNAAQPHVRHDAHALVRALRPAAAVALLADLGSRTRPIALATADAAPSPTATPVPTAAPVSSPTPSATPAAAARTVGFTGLFSQDYPPAPAAPDRLVAIRARLRGHGAIHIDVGEDGRATGIRIDGTDSPDLLRDIRSELLALAYVPAERNGLRCEGTLDIRY